MSNECICMRGQSTTLDSLVHVLWFCVTKQLLLPVGAGRMAQDNGWTVQKCVKSVLVVGTPLYLMWTAEHQKQFPKCTFEGNVWIAIVQYVANGFNFMVFKDNCVRKIANCDMQQVVSVSNNILSSIQVGHTRARGAALEESLCSAFDPNAVSSDDSGEENLDEEDASDIEEESGDEKDLPNGDVRLRTLLAQQHALSGEAGEERNGAVGTGNAGQDHNGDGGTERALEINHGPTSAEGENSQDIARLTLEYPAKVSGVEDPNGDGVAGNEEG
jgi:hypothetical protein